MPHLCTPQWSEVRASSVGKNGNEELILKYNWHVTHRENYSIISWAPVPTRQIPRTYMAHIIVNYCHITSHGFHPKSKKKCSEALSPKSPRSLFLGLKKTSQKPSQIGCWVNAECLSCPPLGMFQLHPTGSVRRGIAPLLLRWFRGFRPRCGLGGLRGVWMRGAAVPGVFRRILGHSQRISFARGVICGAYPSQPQVYGLLVLDPGCGQQCANRRLTTQQPSANHWLEPEI